MRKEDPFKFDSDATFSYSENPIAIDAYDRNTLPGVILDGAAFLAHHDIKLSDDDVIHSGQIYLYLGLSHTNAKKAITELERCALHLVSHPDIAWVVGETWLTSIRNGRLINKLGFNIAMGYKVPPHRVRKDIKAFAMENSQYRNKRYVARVRRSRAHLIYASREDFIQHHLEVAGTSSS